MTVLVGPEWLVAVTTTSADGTPVAFNPAANFVTLRIFGGTHIAGADISVVGRLYMNTTPTIPGNTQVGSQVGPFAVGDGAVHEFTFDAGLITQPYLFSFLGNNQPTATNGAYVALVDDVGTIGSLTTTGCCHDPMLDEILAAVKRVYTNS